MFQVITKMKKKSWKRTIRGRITIIPVSIELIKLILYRKSFFIYDFYQSIKTFLLWKCMYSVSSCADSTPGPLRAKVYATLSHSFLSWAALWKNLFCRNWSKSSFHFFLFPFFFLESKRLTRPYIW